MPCKNSIQALLSAPNPDDPLSENIAKHWKSNEAEAVETGDKIRSKNSICCNKNFIPLSNRVISYQCEHMQLRNGLVFTQVVLEDCKWKKNIVI